ncbi:TetR/AcrR family transcriptional regulator [Marinobacter mobilis]|uniref:Transcriptional regulator, TetR family n=1 Tax=Marinobacter mobilis TaxID=488533 RepID=A0A1H2SC66_9GAMM|nr:TetR/AcrR family transcriptional regulator [Marinobacter mobilis]SDW28734.1 transcriptional regulator, TetR family [Marinobacter mobilis]
MQDAFERVEPGARKANKRHILRCALQCFIEHGLESTTIDTIRQQSGASVGTLYHHFTNKEGLIAALYFIALDDQLAVMLPQRQQEKSVKQALTDLIQTYMAWVCQEPELARFLFLARSNVSKDPWKDALAAKNQGRYAFLQEWLAKGVEQGLILPLPREIYASLLLGQSENYCRAWLSGRVKTPPKEHAKAFAEAAWRSLAVAPQESDSTTRRINNRI